MHTCDCGRCGCIDDGGVVVCLGEGGRHRTLDAQHLSEGVLVAMSHLQACANGEGLPHAHSKSALLGLKLTMRHVRHGIWHRLVRAALHDA